ncbi:MAG TPA: hypothetical protein RMH99_07765 [Sandaracinaceae bacterium LLY-WYZ-13_1]|nr:hypothetical protein [Sandaracinaceae bacterium LLY-WYZ-13_1]
MPSPLQWNDPNRTWRLASYQPPTERRKVQDRRSDERRAALGERRRASRRALASLLRL